MSNSHGDLFGEIGKLVLAANSGQPIDVGATAKDMAERYQNLGISEETIINTVTRSIGAIGISMARVALGEAGPAQRRTDDEAAKEVITDAEVGQLRALFPSGVRLSVLS